MRLKLWRKAMNSAGRILKLLIKIQKQPSISFADLIKNQYSIDASNELLYINFIYQINVEIQTLEINLKEVGKYSKYSKDINIVKNGFSPKPKTTLNSQLIHTQQLLNTISRFEILEDLLEANNIKEEVREYNEIEIIINDINLIIERFEELDNSDYLPIIIMFKEVQNQLAYYQINGVIALEEALEKLFCKGSILSKLISKEVEEDVGKTIGHIYGIWVLVKKYGKKPIEYAKNKYELAHKKEEEIIETELVEEV